MDTKQIKEKLGRSGREARTAKKTSHGTTRELKKDAKRDAAKKQLKEAGRKAFIFVVTLLPILLILTPALIAPQFLLTHLTYPLYPLLFLLAIGIYGRGNRRLVHPPKDKRGKDKRPPEPPKRPTKQIVVDSIDVLTRLDSIGWRIAYLVISVLGIGVTLAVPVGISDFSHGATVDRNLIISVVVPIAAAAVILTRLRRTHRIREEWIEDTYTRVAKPALKYKPLPRTGRPTKYQRQSGVPHLAIDVRRWRNLTEADELYVAAPAEQRASDDTEAWEEFSKNLEQKKPRPEEWRILTKGQKGGGAHVTAANYPRSVLWDGKYDTDPLTFLLGTNLETGESHQITFNDASPHMAVSGATSSGKTSGAEIVAAQVLIKSMPWDPELFGSVDIVDPKGPFARRWQGRPNVVVSNGQQDSEVEEYVYDEEGNPICEKTGVMVMSEHMDHIEEEHKRRANVLAKYPDAGTWVALPDDVKKSERFAPKFVLMDEFLDHTSKMAGNGVRIQMENEAREHIVSLTDWLLRKARNVGIHIIVIAQRANMKLIGDAMMTNMPVRYVTGQIDDAQLKSMFGIEPSDVPRIPTSYVHPESGQTKTVPGRARIMNAMGQSIEKIQTMFFAGPTNSETLDKWVPRGDKPKNGDFSIPTGTRARTVADFDEEGHFIGEPDTASEKAPVDPDGKPLPDTEALPEKSSEASEEAEASSAEPFEDDPETAPEGPEAIFPSAATAVEACAEPSCSAEREWACPDCGRRYCSEHGNRTPNPDPTATKKYVCGSCVESNELHRTGLTALLAEVSPTIDKHGFSYTTDVKERSDGTAYGRLTIRTTDGTKKLVDAFARPTENGHEYKAKSSSGSVDGFEAVVDRIDSACRVYAEKHQSAQYTTKGASDGSAG